MNESFIATLLESNRVTVPQEIVELLKLKPGIKLKLVIERVYR